MQISFRIFIVIHWRFYSFSFDALSHRSSRSSINVAKVDNLGTVSNTSTPLSGSLENIGGGGEVIRKIGTKYFELFYSQEIKIVICNFLSNLFSMVYL